MLFFSSCLPQKKWNWRIFDKKDLNEVGSVEDIEDPHPPDAQEKLVFLSKKKIGVGAVSAASLTFGLLGVYGVGKVGAAIGGVTVITGLTAGWALVILGAVGLGCLVLYGLGHFVSWLYKAITRKEVWTESL
jgi:hypothetical protein